MSDRNAPARAAARGGTATIYMAQKMLIDATHLEETRVVVADGNKVNEFDFESINKRQLAGNIYLAKVTRVEPSLQAAFVDIGLERTAFLHARDLERQDFSATEEEAPPEPLITPIVRPRKL